MWAGGIVACFANYMSILNCSNVASIIQGISDVVSIIINILSIPMSINLTYHFDLKTWARRLVEFKSQEPLDEFKQSSDVR